MSARRYRVKLYRWQRRQMVEEANLDPADTAILRSTLERLVKAKMGTLNLDLSPWWIRVSTMRDVKVAECRVTKTGATTVRRWVGRR